MKFALVAPARVAGPAVGSVLVALVALTGRVGAQCGSQQTQLTSPNATGLGCAVALHGDIAVVGAAFSMQQGSESGSAHVFERGAGWSEVRTLLASNGSASARFGSSVAAFGELVVVGAPGSGTTGGSVYVFERNLGGAANWGERVELGGWGSPTPGQFGWSIALWQDTLAVGAPYTGSTRGGAYLLRRVPATSAWAPFKALAASDGWGGQHFGCSISICADAVVVGAYGALGAGGATTGAAYVFARDAGGADNWGEVAKLAASDGADADRFGSSVAVRGATIVVGANQDADMAYNAGSAYVFERDALGHWNEVRKLLASDGGFIDQFGVSVALDGDEALIGARGAGSHGQAYVFERDFGGAANWGEREVLVPANHPPSGGQFFGCSVALTPTSSLVGAHGSISTPDRGAAYVIDAPPPAPSAYCTAGTAASGCSGAITCNGCPSASANRYFAVTVHGVDATQLGMLFYGVGGRAATPWGASSSVLCMQPPMQRCFLHAASGTSGACDGVLSLIWNDFAAASPNALGQPFANGRTIQMQAVWRDPSAPWRSVLSNALEFTLGP